MIIFLYSLFDCFFDILCHLGSVLDWAVRYELKGKKWITEHATAAKVSSFSLKNSRISDKHFLSERREVCYWGNNKLLVGKAVADLIAVSPFARYRVVHNRPTRYEARHYYLHLLAECRRAFTYFVQKCRILSRMQIPRYIVSAPLLPTKTAFLQLFFACPLSLGRTWLIVA